MSNKLKITLSMSVLGIGIALVFNAVHLATGGIWLLSVPAAIGAALIGRSIYWRIIAAMTNDADVVATDHGPAGRIEAIEVFWRPG